MEPRLIIGGAELCGRITLPPEDERHIVSALRLREGERFVICNANGQEALCALGADKRAEVIELRQSKGEPSVAVHLFPSLMKGERFEWFLQKAVELGAASVTPVLSERCVAGEPSKEKRARFVKIMRAAAEQSGRGKIPELRNTLLFKDATASLHGTGIFCYEDETGASIKNALDNLKRGGEVCVLTGPEGGYTAGEADTAVRSGWKSVTLGNRILRCETAPLMVLSVIQYIVMEE